jgi:hypothetical protein
MKLPLTLFATALALAALPLPASSQQALDTADHRLHTNTDWRIETSFPLDTVCFLNVLTGDPFYVPLYKAEYARFDRQLTPAARTALANLKRKVKDENKRIISADLALYFSATDDRTLNDMLKTVDNSDVMKANLKKTDYYNDSSWQVYESVRPELHTIFLFLKDIQFEDYWRQKILPKLEHRIAEVRKDLPKYNVIQEIETRLGFRLTSNELTVYLVNYAQPHGIRVTGMRFLTDASYPFSTVLRNAVHEPMHPPFNLETDRELSQALLKLHADPYLMDKVNNHDPAFGYNSFGGVLEEDCIQAIEQTINEKFKVEIEARQRWKESDGGMHVLAVAIYKLMKDDNFTGANETFRDFLIRAINSGKLASGTIKTLNDGFYSRRSN